ncbi:MAG: glycosyltransferase family 4 protein [Thaumarchaeota archaeon]|nr:glycosyltransferase family 4 protein [Nitrososphaerota archaeon]
MPIPQTRGASTHVFELARALRRLGDEVHVVCRREASQKSEETISGVHFHRVYRGMMGPVSRSGPRAGIDSESQGLGAISYYLYLRSAYALFAGLVASRLAKDHDLQVILERESAFGAGAIASIISHKPMILEMIGPRYSRLSATVCSKVLAYNEKMIPDGAMGKTVFVKAAVNPDLFKPDQKARESIRARLGLDGSIVVGYVGTFQSWHGLDDLIEAARILLRSNHRFKFLFVGPIPANIKSSIDSELAESLIFAGTVPYESVPDYVNASDIAVAPYNIQNSSRRDKGIGSPLKVLEYMACGKPVVGSSLPQVAEIVVDGETGFLFPQGEPKLLAARITELANNPELRDEMGRAGLEKVRLYSWLSFASRLQVLLEDCVNSQRS